MYILIVRSAMSMNTKIIEWDLGKGGKRGQAQLTAFSMNEIA